MSDVVVMISETIKITRVFFCRGLTAVGRATADNLTTGFRDQNYGLSTIEKM